MTSRATTANRARTLVLDATALAATIDAALDDSDLAGYPSSTPGAASQGSAAPLNDRCDDCGGPLPCRTHRLRSHLRADPRTGPDSTHELGHLSTTNSSLTERGALSTDRARRELDELHEHVRIAAHHLARATKISIARGTARLDKTTVSQRLIDIDRDVWCTNCLRHDMRNPRADKGTLCEFCAGYRARWGRLPSGRVFACRDGRGGRIYENDIIRIHAEDDREADDRRREEKRLAKAAQRAAKAS